uniref:Ras-associating domain-containing protein n=1 Tax=Caenorhabditis tropicalis TaxID=1561998 RepID=A0A1I7TJ23_9PELO
MDDMFIFVRGNGETVKVLAEEDGTISGETLRGAFQLEQDVSIGLFRNGLCLKRRREANDIAFVLRSDWIGAEFELKCRKPQSDSVEPIEQGEL